MKTTPALRLSRFIQRLLISKPGEIIRFLFRVLFGLIGFVIMTIAFVLIGLILLTYIAPGHQSSGFLLPVIYLPFFNTFLRYFPV